MELPFEPAIPLLELYPNKPETPIQKNLCSPMFIATKFTIAKCWKQPRCPSVNEWTKELWYSPGWCGSVDWVPACIPTNSALGFPFFPYLHKHMLFAEFFAFFTSIFKLFFVVQLKLSAFSPHLSTPQQPNPPPSPASNLPLGFVYVPFTAVPENPSPHCPFNPPLWPLFLTSMSLVIFCLLFCCWLCSS